MLPLRSGVAEAFYFLDFLSESSSDIRADFVTRISGVSTSTDKQEVLKSLSEHHEAAAQRLGFEKTYYAEQIHGGEIAVVDDSAAEFSPEVDGLLTGASGVLLGIHVADCGALYLIDQETKALGLLHSGKKGTEGNITGHAIAMMKEHFGTNPAHLRVALAPCIRPPHYEIDFAAQIKAQALSAGVLEEHYHDCMLCTASDLDRFYSYRLEKGDTGRMLALLGRHAL